MNRVFVGLGSNMGDRLGFLQKAVKALEDAPGLTLRSVSSVYETEPVGKKDQPQFLNAVVELSCSMAARECLAKLKETEHTIGRTPSERWGPREIDLDLLYFHDTIIDGPHLAVPHPGVAQRRFVLEPLAEIAADFIDPVRGRSIRELLESCTDVSSVVKTQSAIHSTALES